MDQYSVYIPFDRRQALAQGAALPDRAQGTALFADISGFTPLTEMLVKKYGARRGAEELTYYLNQTFDSLINCLHEAGGAVISFAGDAITCWFDEDDGVRASACALRMHSCMQQPIFLDDSARHPASDTLPVILEAKIAVATGTARRFVVGDPGIQLMDVLAGDTLYQLAAAEHLAEKGEVIVDPVTVKSLGKRAKIARWREHPDTGQQFAVLEALTLTTESRPFAPIPDGVFQEADLKPWLLPPVYERLRQGQGEFLAELRPALVLFLNFTGIDFDQDQLVSKKLDAYVRWVQGVLQTYDAYLFQFIVGDKGNYMYSAFGAPIAHEDDATRAVSAALELLNPPAALNYIQDIKIGISQGRLRTGAYGGLTRRTYGLLGDDVNLAARLMQAADSGQILTNQAVKHSTGKSFRWESLAPIQVKGKVERVEVFSPEGLQPRQGTRFGVQEYTLPMVGRADELALCIQKLDLARQGSGQIVAISGEAGVGKSRLAAEITHRAIEEHQLANFGGECQSYASEISYWVWRPIWRDIFELDSSIDPARQITALEARLATIDPNLALRLPLLSTLLNLPIPENELTQSLDAKLRKASLEALLVDCLRAFTHQRPLLIVLEDCQWIDALSHDLVEVIGRAIPELPVFILMVYRPLKLERLQEARVSLLPHFTEVLLDEFTPEQTHQLITQKLILFSLQPDQVTSELVERIVAQAEGNPFYIEELMNYVHDQGIDLSDHQALTELELPTSVHSLILSRLDQLTEKQQITIKVASVIGRIFEAALLWGMYPELGEPELVQTDLETLAQAQLTTEDPAAQELTYFFKQIVTQQVAYENLPFATRAMLHEQLALYIERNFSTSIQSFIDLLAHHFFRGKNWAKSLEYNLLAAQRDQRDFANDAAITACQRALESADRLDPVQDTHRARLDAHEIMGEVLMLVGQYDEALLAYAAAQELLESEAASLARARRLAELSRKTAEVYERRSEFDTVSTWLERGLSYLDDGEPTLEAAQIYLLDAGLLHRLGRNEEAITMCQKSLATASKIQTISGQRVVAHVHSLLGLIHWRLSDFQQAIDFCAESIKIFRQIEDVVDLAKAYNNLGNVYAEVGDWIKAGEAYHRSLEINQRIGDIYFQGMNANNLGLIDLDQGCYDEAMELLEKSLVIWNQTGAILFAAVTRMNIARVYMALMNWTGTRQMLSTSQQEFKTIDSEDWLAELERYWSELHLHTGDLEGALEHAQRSIELALAQQARLEEGISRRVLGEIYLERREYAAAASELQSSLQILNELGSEFEAGKTTLSLTELALSSDTIPVPQVELVQAAQIFEKLGALPSIDRAKELAARVSLQI